MPRGRVVEFDAHRGIGFVEALDGTRLPFHLTAIADGSRLVEVGTDVEYIVRPGHLGGWEAACLTRVGPGVQAS